MCLLKSLAFDSTKVDFMKAERMGKQDTFNFEKKEKDREREAVVSRTIDVLTYFSGILDKHVVVFGFGQGPL